MDNISGKADWKLHDEVAINEKKVINEEPTEDELSNYSPVTLSDLDTLCKNMTIQYKLTRKKYIGDTLVLLESAKKLFTN